MTTCDDPATRLDAVLTAEAARVRALARDDHAAKDKELARLGIVPTEHPVAGPCRVCGYDRRYAAQPCHCLYCEALN